MKKRLIPIILIILILAAGGILWSRHRNDEDANRIRLSGNLELTRVDISFKAPGKLVQRTVG